MYGPAQLLKALRNPRLGAMAINRVVSHHFLERFRPRSDVFEADWDNLIILDACRFDALKTVGFDSQRLDWRWSDGSNSEEFIRYSVRNGPLDDVVWVTANPWVSRFRDSIFSVLDVWDTGWDDTLDTVPPETVTSWGEKAEEEYPDKRLVVHYMQPHYPFINKTDSDLPNHASFTGGGLRKSDSESLTVWEQLQRGQLETSEVWEAYLQNLNLVLPHAEELADRLTGKTVITSDHGNSFGNRGFPVPLRIYGHPPGLRYTELVKVPWIEYDSGQRKSTVSGKMNVSAETADTAEERLSHLGYR